MRFWTILCFIVATSFVYAQNSFVLPAESEYTIETIEQRTVDSERNHKIPLPDGTSIKCRIEPSDVLAEKVDYIRTYNVYKDNQFIGTYTWSTSGEWYYLNIDGKSFSITPIPENRGRYILEHAKRVHFECGTTHDHSHHHRSHDEDHKVITRRLLNTQKRTYRMAAVCTGEFYELNGNNMNDAMAVLTATVQGLNALYLREMALEFRLVKHKIYDNRATDPFDPSTEDRTALAGEVVHANFDPSTYDIGHAFHKYENDTEWASGGVAILRSVCKNRMRDGSPLKAQGWSGSYTNSGFSWISLAGHEIGHMFGATHTFNGTGGSCTDNIGKATSYEIGSGTTIMSYKGICEESNNIQGDGASDLYFHVNSLLQMSKYIEDDEGGSCPSAVNTGNNKPTVEANPDNLNIKVPKSTPFYLNGQASDTESGLLYCWEQFDEDGPDTPTQGKIGSDAANDARAPLFRSYPPREESYRYFPTISTVASGEINPFDVLSNKTRDVNFLLTVRDNNSAGNAYNIDSVTVRIEPSGPFTIDNQSTWKAGEDVTIKWKTNNSQDLCGKVDILLSIDNGKNFDYILATGLPYEAQDHNMVLPGHIPESDNARIMIKCSDYENFYFFNINKAFKIINACQVEGSLLCPTSQITGDAGSTIFDLSNNLSTITGTPKDTYTKLVNSSSPGHPIYMTKEQGNGCINYFDYVAEHEIIVVDKSGTYTFDTDGSDGTGFISVFKNDGFSIENGCQSFLGSTSRATGGAPNYPISTTSKISLHLDACEEYRIVFYNYRIPANTRCSIYGQEGKVYQSIPSSDIQSTYIAVSSLGTIVKVTQTPDFTDLSKGTYYIYSITYEPTIDVNKLKGQSFTDYKLDGCIKSSYNTTILHVESDCTLLSATNGDPTECDPNTGQSKLSVTMSYLDNLSPDDKININGKSYDVESNNQVVTIDIPAQGSTSVIPVYLESDPACVITLNVKQKENCCPFEITLPESYVRCNDTEVVLDAGTIPGASYQWYQSGTEVPNGNSSTLVGDMGTYQVIVTSSTGCQKSAETTIIQDNSPALSIVGGLTFCEGTTSLITAQTMADSLVWRINNQVVATNTKTHAVDKAGDLVVTAYSEKGCSTTELRMLKTIAAPVVNLGEDVYKCAGESTTLSTDLSGSYKWYRDDTALNETGSSITVDESGTYILEVTAVGAECLGRDTVKVVFETIPSLEVESLYKICEGDSVVITVVTEASIIAFYEGNDTAPIQRGASKSFTVKKAGDIRIIAGAVAECSTTKTTTVEVTNIPTLNIGEDVTACTGTEVEVMSGYTEGVVWTFNGNEFQTPNISITQSGILTLNVTQNGCTAIATKTIAFEEAPTISDIGEVRFCKGSSVKIEPTTNGNTYSWKKGDQVLGNTLELEISEAGLYIFESSFDGNCPSTKEVNVVENALPTIDFGAEEIVICENSIGSISGPPGPYTYVWTKEGTPLSMESKIDVTEPGLYRLEVTDPMGCKNSKSITIKKEPNPTLSIDTENFILCQGDSKTVNLETNGTKVTWKKSDVAFDVANPKSVEITESGNYFVTVENEIGCIDTTSFVVNMEALPEFVINGERSACEGEMVTLEITGNDGQNYEWKTADGEVVNTSNTYTVDKTSTLTIIGYGTNCSTTKNVEVIFAPAPSLRISKDTLSMCKGENRTLSIETDANQIKWFRDNQEIANATTSSISVSQSGVYKAEVSNDGGCAKSIESAVIVYELPEVEIGDDIKLCPGDVITKDINLNNSEKMLWSTGSTTPSINIIHGQSKELKVSTLIGTVTNAGGCSASDSLTIVEHPVLDPVLTYEKATLCTGDTILISVVGGDTFEWQGPQDTYRDIASDRIMIFPSTTATYSVKSSTKECPESIYSTSVDINVVEPAEMSAGIDTCLVKGYPITLNATGGQNYVWTNDGSITENENTATPTIDPTKDTTYEVVISDSNGCSITDQVKVCVYENAEELIKPISMITPNNDGLNDALIFNTLENYESNRLEIYNRWGNLIYAKDDYQKDNERFNGSLGPDPLPADTYYYILTFDGLRIKNTLTIAR